MNNRKRQIAGMISWLLLGSIGTQAAQADWTPGPDTVMTLLPLERYVARAIANHPMLERERANVRQSEAELRVAEKKWMDGLSIDAGTQWGTYGDRTVNTLMLGSRVGFTVRLSLSDIFTQGSTNDQYAAITDQARAQVAVSQRAVVREVIAAYEEAVLARNLYAIAIRELVTARINKQTAQQQFTDGAIALSEMARISIIETDAEAKVENMRSRWTAAVRILGLLTGPRSEDTK